MRTHRKQSVPVRQISPDTGRTLAVYSSMAEAGRKFPGYAYPVQSISLAVRHGTIAFGYRWERVDDKETEKEESAPQPAPNPQPPVWGLYGAYTPADETVPCDPPLIRYGREIYVDGKWLPLPPTYPDLETAIRSAKTSVGERITRDAYRSARDLRFRHPISKSVIFVWPEGDTT